MEVNHVLILKLDGSVYGCGSNEYGQLGTGDNENRNKLTLIMKDSSIVGIRCGSNHSLIWKSNGDIFTFGCNNYGQLGFEDKENRNKPTFLMNLKNDKIIDIQCGYDHNLILTNEELIGFGYNDYGQLGTEDFENKLKPTIIMKNSNNEIKSIYCGGYHSMILKNDGSLFVCGW